MRALRDNRYKLITYDNQPDELYDLPFDPYEGAALDLANPTARQTDAHAGLRAALAALLAS